VSKCDSGPCLPMSPFAATGTVCSDRF
jgi:hypothetical protein